MGGQLGLSLQRQRGLSYWSLILIIAGLGFVLTCVSKLGPGYIDAYYVDQGLKKLAEQDNLRDMTRGQIEQELSRYFMLNNVRGQPTESVQVIRGADSMLISVDYEVRQPLMYNVDVIMRFNKQLNTAKAELCCEPLVDLEQFRQRD